MAAAFRRRERVTISLCKSLRRLIERVLPRDCAVILARFGASFVPLMYFCTSSMHEAVA